MARGWRRYGEARLYMIGSSVGLLVIFWSVLVSQDQATTADTATPAAAQQAPTGSTQAFSVSRQPAAPVTVPQTKTRGS